MTLHRLLLLKLITMQFFICVGLIALANTIGTQIHSEELVFIRFRGQGYDVFALDLDRSLNQNLTRSPGPDELFPRWSPDGQHIVYTLDDGDGGWTLYLMKPTGRDVQTIGRDYDRIADWSPNGQLLIVGSFENGIGHLYRFSLDSGQRTQLTHTLTYDSFAAWSPDGEWIAFTSDRSGSRQIYLMPATGGDPQRITELFDYAAYPDWSPDGQRIAFASDNLGSWHVYTMTPNGDDVRLLAEGVFPVWSPDGKYIAYSRLQDLYIMDSDGQNQRLILKGGLYADWRP